MPQIRLAIKTAEITEDGLLIRSFEIIDATTGETLREADINEDLLEMIKASEINPSKYLKYKQLESKNPDIKNLVNSFKLYT